MVERPQVGGAWESSIAMKPTSVDYRILRPAVMAFQVRASAEPGPASRRARYVTRSEVRMGMGRDDGERIRSAAAR